MENTINIGIDLGTTNSLIARYNNGEVQLFRNPATWKETLASVVAFRKNKIVVGEKAQEYLEKEPQNVVGTFKRKMGTSESYLIQAIGETRTPIELSACVLKELKTFVQTGEAIDSVVITIPASFDTVQSNATKEAGYLAGFKQVVLLQEPIAASLAYANKHKDKDLRNGYWMVYDLGGGTFDVALVKIEEEDMRIVDHEGDNFLGGKDFDAGIIEKILIPHLQTHYSFSDLEKDLKSAAGKYNKDWYVLMHKAEMLKMELSAQNSAEIEIVMHDDDDEEVDESIEIKRTAFENIIHQSIERTTDMMKKIIARNSLNASQIQFILLVGGSTYIPYVKKRLEETLQIPVNSDIDPTTAVALGAAFFAGTKMKTLEEKTGKSSDATLHVKLAYERVSKDTEVFFAALFEGTINNLFYKIIRTDGGFDTGLKTVKEKISETLPLVSNGFNFFQLKVYDKHNNEIGTDAETIGIAQGKYGIVGQPLPEDICLELDNPDGEETQLHLLFNKNSILPIKKTENRIFNRTIKKDSDEQFIINVLEGTSASIPVANKTIGFLAVKGKQLKRDVIKGADIELTIEISESRDLKIVAYIPMLDQEFSQIFTPTQRHIPVERLKVELTDLLRMLNKEINDAANIEDYETAQRLGVLRDELTHLQRELSNLANDDVTDKRYQAEDQKRKIAQAMHETTKDKHINKLCYEYFETKISCNNLVQVHGKEDDKRRYTEIVAKEKDVLNSGSKILIDKLNNEMVNLKFAILWRLPEHIIWIFEWLRYRTNEFTDKAKANNLIESGLQALEKQNYEWLKQIDFQLFYLLPDKEKVVMPQRVTGLV